MNAPNDYIRHYIPKEDTQAIVDHSRERTDLQQQIDAFLAAGGKIQIVPRGVTANYHDQKQTKEQQVRASAQGRISAAGSSTMLSGGAAKFLGMPVEEFRKLDAAGEGPKSEIGQHGRRKRYHVNDLLEWKRDRAA